MPKIFKLKVAEPTIQAVAAPAAEVKLKRVLKLKKTETEVKPKKVFVLKGLPIPPPPAPGVYVTKAMEAFENIREYCIMNNQPISQADIKWYHDELALEKKEMDEFWERCSVTKAVHDAIARGEDMDGILLAEAKAKLTEKKEPLKESDIGEMPAHGTREFWAWCMKRKQLRLQNEAAIVAAGGTVPVKKVKVKVNEVKDKEVKEKI
jgi:hypothetical protein